jgi:hypothetical protein
MQTFLPYQDFEEVALALDSKRLNKQILECYQILNVLSNPRPDAGWRNHPAVKMWRGYEVALFNYAMIMVSEADARSIKTENNVANLLRLRNSRGMGWGTSMPLWFYNKSVMKRVTTTHKANLHKKAPELYPQFAKAVSNKNNKPCCDKCQYFWVTHKENVNA